MSKCGLEECDVSGCQYSHDKRSPCYEHEDKSKVPLLARMPNEEDRDCKMPKACGADTKPADRQAALNACDWIIDFHEDVKIMSPTNEAAIRHIREKIETIKTALNPPVSAEAVKEALADFNECMTLTPCNIEPKNIDTIRTLLEWAAGEG